MAHDTLTANERRSAMVREVDGIMQLEDFKKTPQMQALDDAFIAGRISANDKMEFLLLKSKLSTAQRVLDCIGILDERYATITARRADHMVELREMARIFGGNVAHVFGL